MERIPSYESDFDNLKATELRLGLPGVDLSEKPAHIAPRGSKRLLVEDVEECPSNEASSEVGSIGSDRDAAPLSKTQVVGWPPVRSYWRNISFKAKKEAEVEIETETTRIYVKVSMDGAPYLRKIDLNLYQGYKELREALENMFQCFSLGDGSEYAITYEDKDGDWMLVGDVPWEMFISLCKRLRIMRGPEARGLGSN